MIVLEKFEAKTDVKRLISWVDSTRLNIIWASKKFNYPLDEKVLNSYFEHAAQNGTLVFKVIHKTVENAQVVGHAEIDIKGKEIKISRLLISKQNQGKGFGGKMMQVLIQYIRDHLQYEEIFLTVFTFNKSAIGLYEKMGFVKKEIDKGFMEYEGASWDRLKMVLEEGEKRMRNEE
jgi:RimJ/RimL family protein N-acetyltransferase